MDDQYNRRRRIATTIIRTRISKIFIHTSRKTNFILAVAPLTCNFQVIDIRVRGVKYNFRGLRIRINDEESTKANREKARGEIESEKNVRDRGLERLIKHSEEVPRRQQEGSQRRRQHALAWRHNQSKERQHMLATASFP